MNNICLSVKFAESCTTMLKQLQISFIYVNSFCVISKNLHC